MIHESMGNGTEAENLFQRGKVISSLQGLPILEIAFTSLLGISFIICYFFFLVVIYISFFC